MATPQWVLLQRRIEPTQKSFESQYEKNARKRQKEAVRSAVRRGFLKHLDQQMILESVDDSEVADSYQVKYISLPASSIQSIDDLAIISSTKLRVVNLPYNYLTDLNPFHSCVNLIKLDVSGNQIRNVPDSSFWTSLLSLKILYLNNNMISGKETLLSLSRCTSLQVLTMYDNPVSLLPNYRHIAVNCILSLKALDYHVISDEEIIENLHLSGKFRSRAKPFHRLLYLPVNKGDSLADELRKIYDMILGIDMILAHHSPVVIIQRWIRGWLTRNRLLKCSVPQLRELVEHREKGSRHANMVMRRSTTNSFVKKRDEGRLGTSDLPFPPPTTPAVNPALHLHPSPMEAKKDPNRPTTTEVKKTIKTTKEILNNNGRKKKRKTRTTSKMLKDMATSTNTEVQLSVYGEHQTVGQINRVDHVRDMKTKDASKIREAESSIKKTIMEMKKNVPVEKRAATWAKDSHAFIRAHTTMSLSMLKDITRRQCTLRRENEVSKKAAAIARVKQEREARKKMIYENQLVLRDTIAAWRAREERRLQERKQQMELEYEELRLKRADNMETMAEAMKSRREGEKYVTNFTQQHTLLDRTAIKEQTESLKKAQEESQKEKVQKSRLLAQEQAEIVNKFMEMRQKKLRSETSEQKEKLNAQMIQFASQKLMEAKQKVAKVKAWKKIAKSLKAPTEDSNMATNTLANAFESIPEADAVDVGLLGPLLKAYTSTGLTNGYSPQSMRKTTHESHRTWQRGCVVIQEENEDDQAQHFPTLEPVSDLQPLMYDQLQPHSYFHAGTTPCNSYHSTPTTSNTHLRPNSPVLNPPDSIVTGQLIQELMVD